MIRRTGQLTVRKVLKSVNQLIYHPTGPIEAKYGGRFILPDTVDLE
jgi:hypothetical protein